MAVWHSQQRWFTVMWLLYSQNTFPHSPHRANISCTVSASSRQMSALWRGNRHTCQHIPFRISSFPLSSLLLLLSFIHATRIHNMAFSDHVFAQKSSLTIMPVKAERADITYTRCFILIPPPSVLWPSTVSVWPSVPQVLA